MTGADGPGATARGCDNLLRFPGSQLPKSSFVRGASDPELGGDTVSDI